jgi:hypothetical protein
MHARSLFVALSSLALLLAGCGKEVGRVPFAASGSGTANVTLEAGDVDFWTDIDVEYRGDAALQYHVDLEQGGAGVATAACNPLGPINVKTSWVETNLGSAHSRSGMGKMSCSVKLAKGGPTKVKATFTASKSATLKKADLVLKQ